MIINATSEILNYLKLDAVASIVITYPVKYPIGAKIYIAPYARKGKVEAICVKKHLVSDVSIVYQDTFNSLWMEEELCTHAEAKEYALTYWEWVSETYLNL